MEVPSPSRDGSGRAKRDFGSVDERGDDQSSQWSNLPILSSYLFVTVTLPLKV